MNMIREFLHRIVCDVEVVRRDIAEVVQREAAEIVRRSFTDVVRRDSAELVDQIKAMINQYCGLLAQSQYHERIYGLAMLERRRYATEILADPIYDNKQSLLRYGSKVYSQCDEDGVIQEIFARIGTGRKTFVEFGVSNGLENNTVRLLLDDWSGVWLESDKACVESINVHFNNVIREGRLHVDQAMVDRDNINALIGRYHEGEIDLISIDVDGNDIHLMQALTVVSPRVIVVEYNAAFPPPLSIAQSYDPNHRWRGGNYFGASLAAITKVADEKGYALVGCSLSGGNAFFVRRDLIEENLLAPFTAEQHFQPARYYLAGPSGGHPPDWGNWISI
jgi:hypothetical protein